MPVIGVDFDNTIVSYDDVMHETAQQFGLIESSMKKNKKAIRDYIRQLPDGELQWQKLQTFVYGKAMDRAGIFEGVQEFFHSCQQHKIKVYIVSHKTMYGSMDQDKTNLRDAALRWMADKKFFETSGFGLSKDQIFFESTRQEKINRIKTLGCTHFIDDLEETFREADFPKDIEKILYADYPVDSINNIKAFDTWKGINDYFFKAKK